MRRIVPVRYVRLNLALLDESGRVLGIELNGPDKRELQADESTTFSEETSIAASAISQVVFLPEWNDVEQELAEVRNRQSPGETWIQSSISEDVILWLGP